MFPTSSPPFVSPSSAPPPGVYGSGFRHHAPPFQNDSQESMGASRCCFCIQTLFGTFFGWIGTCLNTIYYCIMSCLCPSFLYQAQHTMRHNMVGRLQECLDVSDVSLDEIMALFNLLSKEDQVKIKRRFMQALNGVISCPPERWEDLSNEEFFDRYVTPIDQYHATRFPFLRRAIHEHFRTL